MNKGGQPIHYYLRYSNLTKDIKALSRGGAHRFSWLKIYFLYSEYVIDVVIELGMGSAHDKPLTKKERKEKRKKRKEKQLKK